MYNLFYMEAFSVVMGFPAAMTYMDVFYCLCTGKRMFRWGALLLEVFMLVLPPLLLYFFDAGDIESRLIIRYDRNCHRWHRRRVLVPDAQ